MTKKCFKCGIEKNLKDFYEHRGMKDGHLNKCKDCTKLDAHITSHKIKRDCEICGRKFGTCNSEITRGGGITCSRKCHYIRFRRNVKRGSDSPNWKGDDVGLGALHDWVKRELGKPKYCEICKSTKAKKYEWANISGKYKRELSDWKRLCTKCHIKMDGTVNKRKKTLVRKYGWKTGQ